MEKREYKKMFGMEEDYWWYRGLRDIVSSFIIRFLNKHPLCRMLDAGCGTGKFLEDYGSDHAYGLELSEEAFRFLKRRGLKNIIKASVCDMPFKDRSFRLVVSLDVLYHADVENDELALVEIHRVLEKKGLLILNLPAFEFLRSEHDRAIHTKRRYKVEDLQKRLEDAGFSIHMISYRNAFLFPAAMMMRLIRMIIAREGNGAKSDLYALPRWVNHVFYGMLMVENRLLAHGINFPFGLSIFCVAGKGRSD